MHALARRIDRPTPHRKPRAFTRGGWRFALMLLGLSACSDAESADSVAPLAAQQAEPGEATDDEATPPPAPVEKPAVWGYGIGVSDVPAAIAFYTEVMQMTVEKADVRREDRTETVLYASGAKRGARIVLMKYDDARNTRKITAKVVFQASNASAISRAASRHPDYKSRLNIGIVQFDGPETYIHEVGGIFDSGGRGIRVPYPVALGFVVSDLTASRRFYTALGMNESRVGSFRVSDATGSGSITEYAARFSEGAGLVLQSWSPSRNAKDNPIKVVMFVPDAQATANALVARGGTLVRPAERTPVYDNRLLIVAKDPDGYLLELVQ